MTLTGGREPLQEVLQLPRPLPFPLAPDHVVQALRHQEGSPCGQRGMSHASSSGAGGPAPPQAPFLKGLSSESPKGSRLCHGSSIWGRKRALSRDGGSRAAGIPRHQRGTERGGEGRDTLGLPAAPRQCCCPPGSSPGPHLDVFLGVLGRGSLPQRVAPGLGRTLADTKRQAAASRRQLGSRAGARSCGTPPRPACPTLCASMCSSAAGAISTLSSGTMGKSSPLSSGPAAPTGTAGCSQELGRPLPGSPFSTLPEGELPWGVLLLKSQHPGRLGVRRGWEHLWEQHGAPRARRAERTDRPHRQPLTSILREVQCLHGRRTSAEVQGLPAAAEDRGPGSWEVTEAGGHRGPTRRAAVVAAQGQLPRLGPAFAQPQVSPTPNFQQ